VIRQHREGRVIILTTHFMDEADLLGDRIAIMGDGKLLCCGSSLFLKKNYGVGYNMVLEKQSAMNFNEDNAMEIVHSIVPQAKLLTNVGTEVTVQLPFAASSQFSTLFQKLDNTMESLGIQSYGMSVTTLEEVFLKVASGSHAFVTREKEANQAQAVVLSQSNAQDEANLANPDVEIGGDHKSFVVSFEKYDINTEMHIITYRQLIALLKKRALIFSRDNKAWLFQYILPVLFVLLGVVIMYVSVFSVDQPEIKVSIDDYNPGIDNNILPFPYTNGSSFHFKYKPTYGGGLYYGGNSNNLEGQTHIMSFIQDNDLLPLESCNDCTRIYNISKYLYDYRKEYKASRYGALSIVELGYTENITVPTQIKYIVHSNYTAVHGGPIFNTFAAETFVRNFGLDTTISLRLHPLPETKLQSTLNDNFNLSNLVFFLLLAVPFLASSFGSFVVAEKENKSKQQQLVSGVSVYIYWISSWVWDVCTYQVTMWLFIIIIVSFPDTDNLWKGSAFGATVAMFYLFGVAISSFSYVMAFFMTKANQAQITILFVVFVLGLILTIVGVVLRTIPSTRDVYLNYIRYFFCLSPSFALGEGLTNMAVIEFLGYSELGGGESYTPYDLKIAGLNMIMMAATSVAYFLTACILDYASTSALLQSLKFGKTPPLPEDTNLRDEDVIAEDMRVQTEDAQKNSSILLNDVKKVYGNGKYAVKGVSLGIPNGECFGLLGINGAGKTTLLNILSGDTSATDGAVKLLGMDLFQNLHKCRQHIGFCPQFDALFDLLTAREHLTLYAEMKGIKPKDVSKEVEAKLVEMGLSEYANRTSNGYSGGNKRKLSVAMAMVGEPSLVFLDGKQIKIIYMCCF
jgi:ABC-type multidrug transport system ATPase subunit